jgi:hypothetical protein
MRKKEIDNEREALNVKMTNKSNDWSKCMVVIEYILILELERPFLNAERRHNRPLKSSICCLFWNQWNQSIYYYSILVLYLQISYLSIRYNWGACVIGKKIATSISLSSIINESIIIYSRTSKIRDEKN